MNPVTSAPLFRDPMHDGAADPVAVFNRQSGEWWLVYTNRRTTAPGPGVTWVHGTDLGVATSADGGRTWTYRGTLTGLDTEWGRNTFWAPEIIWHDGLYHMYVSYLRGVPDSWTGPARIRHYTSLDLLDWTYHGALDLGSDRIIDACVFQLPGGGWRMWFKDETRGSLTYAADSSDLYHWRPTGLAVGHRPHEGPNVFALGGYYWMLVDEWQGQGVLRSDDLTTWEHHGLILDKPGSRPDDGTIGLHADVVVQGDTAYVFYFTHPGRVGTAAEDDTYATRRSSLQVAAARVVDGTLHCDRDEPVRLDLAPVLQPGRPPAAATSGDGSVQGEPSPGSPSTPSP